MGEYNKCLDKQRIAYRKRLIHILASCKWNNELIHHEKEYPKIFNGQWSVASAIEAQCSLVPKSPAATESVVGIR